MARRPKRLRSLRRPRLSIPEILGWADEYFAANGKWPNINSGSIPGTINDTWQIIEVALRQGHRGLSRRTTLSLARLLEKHRGVRNSQYPPKLTTAKIVKWAQNHHDVTGDWPQASSGAIDGAPGETWAAVDLALAQGRRGLPGGNTLARLLSDRFGVRQGKIFKPLTEEQILAWADDHILRWGRRPTRMSGPVANAPGESWLTIDYALMFGTRTLRGRQTLVQLLDRLRPHTRRRRRRRRRRDA